MSRTRAAIVGWCGVVAAVLVAGCGGNLTVSPTESATATSTSPSPVTTSPEQEVTSPPVQTTSRPPTTRAPRTTRPRTTSKQCDIADLSVSLRGEEGAAGTVYRGLVFSNTGRRTCTIQGFPGVSFVAGDDGHQVGRPAVWDGSGGPVITLTPGTAASATLAFPNVGNWDAGACRPTEVRGLRVYPPHDTRAEFVPLETTACAGSPPGGHLRARSVHAGTNLS